LGCITPAQAQILTDYETIAKNGGAGLIGGGTASAVTALEVAPRSVIGGT